MDGAEEICSAGTWDVDLFVNSAVVDEGVLKCNGEGRCASSQKSADLSACLSEGEYTLAFWLNRAKTLPEGEQNPTHEFFRITDSGTEWVVIKMGTDQSPNTDDFCFFSRIVDEDLRPFDVEAGRDDGGWTHVAASWDSQTVRLYANGVLEEAAAFSLPIYLGGGEHRFKIGKDSPSQGQWAGSLLRATLHCRALDVDQIRALRDEFAPPAGL